MAQLYKQEFKAQEKAKEERIKQYKEEAIGERKQQEILQQRKEQEEKARITQQEAERVEREREETVRANDEAQRITQEQATNRRSSSIGADWSSVSPEQASQYMSTRTPIPASKWSSIIYAESTNNPTATNSQSGTFGYLQLHPVHGNVSGMTPQQYLDTAVSVYNSQGLSAWEVVTLGMVN